jgi:hypothetical protein
LSKDYSGQKKWRDLQKRYSRAQLDYPEGIGWQMALKILKNSVGLLDLWQVSPEQLEKVIDRCRKEYQKIHDRHNKKS